MRDARAAPARPAAPRGKGRSATACATSGSRPDLVLVLVVVFFAGTFGMNFQITTALMATQVFDKGAGEYGILGSIMAIGSLAGALLAARRGRPARCACVVAAAAPSALLEIVAGLMPTYWPFALVAAARSASPR